MVFTEVTRPRPARASRTRAHQTRDLQLHDAQCSVRDRHHRAGFTCLVLCLRERVSAGGVGLCFWQCMNPSARRNTAIRRAPHRHPQPGMASATATREPLGVRVGVIAVSRVPTPRTGQVDRRSVRLRRGRREHTCSCAQSEGGGNYGSALLTEDHLAIHPSVRPQAGPPVGSHSSPRTVRPRWSGRCRCAMTVGAVARLSRPAAGVTPTPPNAVDARLTQLARYRSYNVGRTAEV